jgi:DNA repair protein RadA/Sms
VAAALISALADKQLPQRSSYLGEVSYPGVDSTLAHAGLRLREAAKLGFELACGPEDVGEIPPNLRYRALDRLSKLVDRIMAEQ